MKRIFLLYSYLFLLLENIDAHTISREAVFYYFIFYKVILTNTILMSNFILCTEASIDTIIYLTILVYKLYEENKGYKCKSNNIFEICSNST